jgi:hypothetical protein
MREERVCKMETSKAIIRVAGAAIVALIVIFVIAAIVLK